MSQGTMTLAMSLPSLGLTFSLLGPRQGSGRGKGSGFENPFFLKCLRGESHFLSFILLLSLFFFITQKSMSLFVQN